MFSQHFKILNFGKTAFVKIIVFSSRDQRYIHKNLICGTKALEGPGSKSIPSNKVTIPYPLTVHLLQSEPDDDDVVEEEEVIV